MRIDRCYSSTSLPIPCGSATRRIQNPFGEPPPGWAASIGCGTDMLMSRARTRSTATISTIPDQNIDEDSAIDALPVDLHDLGGQPAVGGGYGDLRIERQPRHLGMEDDAEVVGSDELDKANGELADPDIWREIGGDRVEDLVDQGRQVTTRHYASVARQLRTQGTPIPTNHIWIAALVLQHDLALYARDPHFDHLPQLVRV